MVSYYYKTRGTAPVFYYRNKGIKAEGIIVVWMCGVENVQTNEDWVLFYLTVWIPKINFQCSDYKICGEKP